MVTQGTRPSTAARRAGAYTRAHARAAARSLARMRCGSVDVAEGAQVAVVVVDHGSRRKESNDMLLDFCELYRRCSGRQIVEPAHMEIAEPTIAQAVGRCVARGASHVVVAPYFLSAGRHVQADIPALVEETRRLYPGVGLTVAQPFGVDPLLAQLVDARVQMALQVDVVQADVTQPVVPA